MILELVANPLDRGADIGSVAIFAAPCHEPDMMHAVTEPRDTPSCGCADIRAASRRTNVEFGQREIDVGVVPSPERAS